jgi:hypothetical protein
MEAVHHRVDLEARGVVYSLKSGQFQCLKLLKGITHTPNSTKPISPLFLKKLDVEAMTDTVGRAGHTSDTCADIAIRERLSLEFGGGGVGDRSLSAIHWKSWYRNRNG